MPQTRKRKATGVPQERNLCLWHTSRVCVDGGSRDSPHRFHMTFRPTAAGLNKSKACIESNPYVNDFLGNRFVRSRAWSACFGAFSRVLRFSMAQSGFTQHIYLDRSTEGTG